MKVTNKERNWQLSIKDSSINEVTYIWFYVDPFTLCHTFVCTSPDIMSSQNSWHPYPCAWGVFYERLVVKLKNHGM